MNKMIVGLVLGGVLGALSGYWFAEQQPRHYLESGVQWQFNEAAGRGDVRELIRLHALGAEINAEPHDEFNSGDFALVAAASNGRSSAVRWLIENGADVNRAQSDRPLACAKYRLTKTQKVIEMLLAKGPDSSVWRKPDKQSGSTSLPQPISIANTRVHAPMLVHESTHPRRPVHL